MDHKQFDQLTRSVATLRSRRTLLGALGLAALALPWSAEARNRKKKKRQKAKLNDFGCVNVGGFCKNSGQCCSGICQGKTGKMKCRAHDTSTCQVGQNACDDEAGVPCVTSTGAENGACDTTTGNAPYCTGDGKCFTCTKDADCVPFCGAQAACVICEICEEDSPGVVTACVGPTPGGCTFPD